MDYISILALIGSLLALVANIPQVYKVRKSNSTNDLHYMTVILHILSGVVWSMYGFLLNQYILGVEAGAVSFLNILIFLAIIRDKYFCYPHDTTIKKEIQIKNNKINDI